MTNPNFFIIGAPRSGTTSLNVYLRNHPNIFLSELKEPCYFDFDLLKGAKISLKEYLALFSKADPNIHKVVGEASPTYLFSKSAVPEILKFNPDSKFVVILRNPIDYLESLHSLRIFWGEENILDFEKAWRAETERKNGKKIPISCREIKWLMYSEWGKLGDQIERLFSCVEKEKVKVIIFNDFIANPKKTYEEILLFLNLPSDGRNEFPKLNETKKVKLIVLQQIFSIFIHFGKIVRNKLKIGMKTYGMLTKILSLNSNTFKKNALSDSFRSELNIFFQKDVEKLSNILNRDLTFWLNSENKPKIAKSSEGIKKSVILGLNAFHSDSAACILVNGVLKAAIAEERLGKRQKHVAGFPALAIRKVLELAGLSIKDVDYVAYGHNHNSNLHKKLLRVISKPSQSIRGVAKHLKRRKISSFLQQKIASECGFELDHCKFLVYGVEHHLAHMASSYFTSPFETAAGFTYDGSGDFVSGMYAECRENHISIIDKVYLPNSLGFFYTAICQFLGFDRFGEEYKVMGLSAYGEPKHMDLMREILSVSKSKYIVNPRYVQNAGGKSVEEWVDENGEVIIPRMFTNRLKERLGEPRKKGDEFSKRDYDVAASMQMAFEEIVLKCLGWLHGKVPNTNLITAGGCALNGVCNSRILRDTPFKNSFIQCAASDDGTAIGAAFYVWNQVIQKPRGFVMDHAYFGSEATDAEIEATLQRNGLKYEKLEREPVLKRIAEYLSKGKVVGWFQGRSEWGPRALGNRSLLAHPGWPGMKEMINQKIKRRESFRPFAPSILGEEVSNYFEQTLESPFMMHVVKIRPEKREALSAVCHEDFTGRLQTVKRSQNELYYDLIKEFSKLTGTHALLNTSFNENEPIVETPEQAVACYLRNDVDALCMGTYLTSKEHGKPSLP